MCTRRPYRHRYRRRRRVRDELATLHGAVTHEYRPTIRSCRPVPDKPATDNQSRGHVDPATGWVCGPPVAENPAVRDHAAGRQADAAPDGRAAVGEGHARQFPGRVEIDTPGDPGAIDRHIGRVAAEPAHRDGAGYGDFRGKCVGPVRDEHYIPGSQGQVDPCLYRLAGCNPVRAGIPVTAPRGHIVRRGG